MRLYIIYAHSDTARIKTLLQILNKLGHDSWFDRRVPGGGKQPEQLIDAIHQAGAVIYAISPDSMAAKKCRWELAQASGAKKKLIPVLFKSSDEILQKFGKVRYVNLTEGADINQAAGQLNQWLTRLAPKPESPPPQPVKTPLQILSPPPTPAVSAKSVLSPVPEPSIKAETSKAKVKPPKSKVKSPLPEKGKSSGRRRLIFIPLVVLLIAIIALAGLFFSMGGGEEEESPLTTTPDADYYYELGLSLFEQGQYTEARDRFNQAIVLAEMAADMKPEYYFYRGRTYFKQEQYDEALADYNQALEISNLYAEAYAHRGWVYVKQENYDLAFADAEKALDYNTNIATAYYVRGFCYSINRDYEAALADYTEALDLNFESPELAHNNRGQAQYFLGNYEQAITDFSNAISLDRENPVFYVNLGAAFRASGQAQPAIESYNNAIEMGYTPEARVYTMLAAVYRDLEDYENAESDYLRAIELDPEFPNAYWGLGAVYEALQRPEDALENYHVYLDLMGNEAPESARAFVEQFEIIIARPEGEITKLDKEEPEATLPVESPQPEPVTTETPVPTATEDHSAPTPTPTFQRMSTVGDGD